MSQSTLGFTVTLARDLTTLREACALRALAYGRHLKDAPGMARTLAEPEALDLAAGTTVLVCRDKAGGPLVGTARIQRNHPLPLAIEDSIVLPPALSAHPRAEITRLAIRPGADRRVWPALVKALWMFAAATQIRTLVIGARNGALLRQYVGLGFTSLDAGTDPPRTWSLAHTGGLPHHVLVFDVPSAERRWHAQKHPLYGFMVDTWHPDIDLLCDRALHRGAPPSEHRA